MEHSGDEEENTPLIPQNQNSRKDLIDEFIDSEKEKTSTPRFRSIFEPNQHKKSVFNSELAGKPGSPTTQSQVSSTQVKKWEEDFLRQDKQENTPIRSFGDPNQDIIIPRPISSKLSNIINSDGNITFFRFKKL